MPKFHPDQPIDFIGKVQEYNKIQPKLREACCNSRIVQRRGVYQLINHSFQDFGQEVYARRISSIDYASKQNEKEPEDGIFEVI